MGLNSPVEDSAFVGTDRLADQSFSIKSEKWEIFSFNFIQFHTYRKLYESSIVNIFS